MDVKAKIEEIVEKVKSDAALQERFKSDPVKAVEGLLGVDLPDDTVKQIAEGVKAKISLDKLGGVADGIKGLFGKK